MSTLNLGDSLILDSDYSTTEKKTGATWIDGRPIYMKVVTITPTQVALQNYSANIGGVDSAWIVNGWLTDGLISYSCNCNYSNGSHSIYSDIVVDSSKNVFIRIAVTSGFVNKPIKYILEYTKTTD